MKLLKLLVPATAAAFLVTGCGPNKNTKTETTKTTTETAKKDDVKVELKSSSDVALNKPVSLELAVTKDGKELKDATVEVVSADSKKVTAKFDDKKNAFVASVAAPSKEGEVDFKVNVTPKGETTAKESTVKVNVKKS